MLKLKYVKCGVFHDITYDFGFNIQSLAIIFLGH